MAKSNPKSKNYPKKSYDKYDVPSWAGTAPSGLHLDVLKEGKMIEKMMIDEKKCYFFGRNSIVCDFVLDHASCSRVHAVLMWHKFLNRSFVVDLGSTHGTFLGSIQLEANKPQQVLLDSTIRFGASSRSYILRERPQTAVAQSLGESKEEEKQEELTGGLLGLPEEETELNNLTEFNTAHNKRVGGGGFEDNLQSPEVARSSRKRKLTRVNFSEEDEIINPEDIDPSVGRFRNLVQTSVVPIKKRRSEDGPLGITAETMAKRLQGLYSPSLYSDLPNANDVTSPTATTPTSPQFGTISSSTLGFMHMPNLAPDVDPAPSIRDDVSTAPVAILNPPTVPAGPKKKVYAKEAWPGKKPTPSLLL